MFKNAQESHNHSLQTLNQLYEYDDFMQSISTVLDLGCGEGLDIDWWDTRTTRDEIPEPLNIRCTGIDLSSKPNIFFKRPRISFYQIDFEDSIPLLNKSKYDVLWSHDSFQYCINPLATLTKWKEIASPDAMLALIFPQTANIESRNLNFVQQSQCFYHHSIVSLIHMLAITGWDCRGGFFKKDIETPWLHVIAYNHAQHPLNPKTTWYELADLGLLPDSAVESINRHGYLQQQDLILPWIDKSITWFGKP